MRASMVVVVCDGACGEATTVDVDHNAVVGLDTQLRMKGWSLASDGADLCGDCTRAEVARSAVAARLAERSGLRLASTST